MQFVSIIAKVLKYDSGVVETSLDYCEDYEICSMNDLPHELRNNLNLTNSCNLVNYFVILIHVISRKLGTLIVQVTAIHSSCK